MLQMTPDEEPSASDTATVTAPSGDVPEQAYWVAFHKVPYIGPARLQRLLDTFGNLSAAWHAPEGELRRCLEERAKNELVRMRQTLDVAATYDLIVRNGARISTPIDLTYPSLLAEIPAPPPVLYYRGELLETDRTAVAIVGTRRFTPYGRDMAARIASDLARAGVTIVSGLARGIDGVAHQAALDAGGRTIAVLGSGIDRIYPPEHRKLAERIMEQGAVLSDYLPDTPPDGVNFPPRNRIISGLSLGVVVVEAPDRSGALITVDFAADQGRDIFAVPGMANATNSAGTNRLIREGARLVRSAEDILDDLQLGRTQMSDAVQHSLPLGEGERRLLAVMTALPQHIDDLAELSDSTVAEVSGRLMMLELQGLVRNVGAQHYARA
jgi:DNA processing protein